MAAPQVFKVLTEFRFEIGQAVAASDTVSQSVQGITNASNAALLSMQRLSLGIASSFLSGPGGGLLGILGKALLISDQFQKTQIQFANILGKSTGDFNSRMEFAEKTLQRINKLSQKFALPSQDLTSIVKIVAPALRQELGPSQAFDKSIELGRFFLKSAPTLGIDPGEALIGLQNSIVGVNVGATKLFRILVTDTKVMREFAGEGAKFAKLPIQERVQKLIAAFKEFGDDVDAVAAVTNTVSFQFRKLQDSFLGIFSVLRPLGDAINGVAVQVLLAANAFVQGDLRNIFSDMASAIEPFTRDARDMIATFMQLRTLKEDLERATNITKGLIVVSALSFAMGFLGVQIPFVTAGFLAMSRAITFLTATAFGPLVITAAKGAGIFRFLFAGLDSFLLLISRILGPLILLVGVFQFFSRALATAKIDRALKLVQIVDDFTKIGASFARLFGIFKRGFDSLADNLLAPILGFFLTAPVEAFGKGLAFIVENLILATAGFQGLAFVMLDIFSQLKDFLGEIPQFIKNVIAAGGNVDVAIAKSFPSGGLQPGRVGSAFEAGVQSILDEVFGAIEEGRGIINQTTNIGKIDINNQFREKIEPDRVAFTVKEQLLKAALNPTQARGRAFNPAVAR